MCQQRFGYSVSNAARLVRARYFNERTYLRVIILTTYHRVIIRVPTTQLLSSVFMFGTNNLLFLIIVPPCFWER